MRQILAILAFAAVGLATSAAAAGAAPVLTNGELATVVQQAEAAGTVESIEVVSAGQQAVEAAFSPREVAAGIQRPAASLALVVARGKFADVNSKAPHGAPVPSGSVMSFVFNRDTGRVAALSVSDAAPATPAGAVVERAALAVSRTAHAASRRHASRRRRAHEATWGSNCKVAGEHHCYVVTEWVMKGAEEVIGANSEQVTSHINVPGWEKGYFVDNEEWAWAKAIGPSTWSEVGQQAGEYKGCCNTWWFYAYENGTEGYEQFVDAPYVWEVPEKTGNHYTMGISGGDVCWYYGVENTLEACREDFAWQATVLEAGGEIATEAKPSFAASVNNAAEWTNGTWHTWNFAAQTVTSTGLCWSHLNSAPGNIYYDTC